MHIQLITSASGDVRMLRDFCEYYSDLGVHRILINLIDTVGDGKIVEECRQIFAGKPHLVANVYKGEHSWTKQVELLRKTKAHYCGPEDWVLFSDLNERHDYRRNLHAILIEAERNKENLLVGEFLDRVSSTGELIEYNPQKSVFEQFPVACKVSLDLLRAPRLRTIAIRGDVHVSKPFCFESDLVVQRAITNGEITVRKGDPIAVHHFKWHAGVLERIRARLEFYKTMANAGMSDFSMLTDCERFFSHLQANGGRLNLTDGSIRIVFEKDRRRDPVWTLEAIGI